jgi:exodeoxyribonuclease VII large subunit
MENFFDFREKLSARREPAPRAPAANGKEADALTVTQLTAQIERAIKSGVPATVHVKGEVSNLNLHRGSGHLYFTLKDAGACIDCVMFRSDVARLKFMPDDGIELLASGRVAVYPQRGRYQLYATALHPIGRGALELAFQQLCEKLEREGLFEAERKKVIPRFPVKMALVTSRSTAALQDMLKVLRRFPWIQLGIYHVPVQGDGSAEQIAAALRTLSAAKWAEVILLGRGGGSLEDLWEFNEEIVARAVAASQIPIVTGIGHEVDVSIADLVADCHAHTPTEAAQVATSNWRIAADVVDTQDRRMVRALSASLADAKHRLNAVHRHEFFRRPTDRINQLRQLLDDRQQSLLLSIGDLLHRSAGRMARIEARLAGRHPRHTIKLCGQKLSELDHRLGFAAAHDMKQRAQQIDLLERHLQAVSPEAVLKRGYSITTRKKAGAIVRSAGDVSPGERLITRLADGTIESTVEDQSQLPLFE